MCSNTTASSFNANCNCSNSINGDLWKNYIFYPNAVTTSIGTEHATTATNTIKTKERNQEMSLMKNFNFGPCDGAKISPIGIAVKNSNDEWVSYDKEKNEIVNVDLLNFGNSNFVYTIPVAIKDVAKGDAIVHNHHIMFVKKVKDDSITVIDITSGEHKKILPTKSMFGFDYVAKLVSLVDFTASTANEDNPFGDMLPFLLMSDGKDNGTFPLALMLMNKDGQDGELFSSSTSSTQMMLMAMMMGNDRQNCDMQNLLPLMFLMNKNMKQ
jgi:hypothetical protein